MKTSYYANLQNIKYPISIAGKAPDSYHGPEYKVLAPKWSFFSQWKYGDHKGDNDYYIENFNKLVLGTLDPQKVLKDLQSFYPNVPLNEITLICYEKPGDFCHRHLVAYWLTMNGEETTELPASIGKVIQLDEN